MRNETKRKSQFNLVSNGIDYARKKNEARRTTGRGVFTVHFWNLHVFLNFCMVQSAAAKLESEYALRNLRAEWTPTANKQALIGGDLKRISRGGLPWKVKDAHNVQLGMDMFVQVEDVIDISQSNPRPGFGQSNSNRPNCVQLIGTPSVPWKVDADRVIRALKACGLPLPSASTFDSIAAQGPIAPMGLAHPSIIGEADNTQDGGGNDGNDDEEDADFWAAAAQMADEHVLSVTGNT